MVSVSDILILTRVFFEPGDQGDKSPDIKDIARGRKMGPIFGIKGYNHFLALTTGAERCRSKAPYSNHNTS